ncbi:hypothetical protein RRSWK_05844 [Rhodopirellula sp. SWK7]|nr:hypothetical protein RRSWK_05844 [Rhodopirellula sp. SWK7]
MATPLDIASNSRDGGYPTRQQDHCATISSLGDLARHRYLTSLEKQQSDALLSRFSARNVSASLTEHLDNATDLRKRNDQQHTLRDHLRGDRRCRRLRRHCSLANAKKDRHEKYLDQISWGFRTTDSTRSSRTSSPKKSNTACRSVDLTAQNHGRSNHRNQQKDVAAMQRPQRLRSGHSYD